MNKRNSFLIALLCIANVVTAADNVLVQVWEGVDGANIEDFLTGDDTLPLYPRVADREWHKNLFNIPATRDTTWPNYPADDYVGRAVAIIVPPATGDYTFWLCTDDDGRLWLSTDDTPDNCVEICRVDGWLPENNFDPTAGSADHATSGSKIQSDPITLTAGQRYYLEGALDEDGGGDHLVVHWSGPSPIGSTHISIAEQYLRQYIRPGIDDTAQNPSPADGATHNQTAGLLQWTPGVYAAKHHVYMGTNGTDVANGTGGTDKGLVVQASYIATGLVPGTTYYWRVDEVNDTNPSSPWGGDVWSFTVADTKAYDPDPADGAVNIPKNSTLTWTPGMGVSIQEFFIGTDYDTVLNAAPGGGALIGSGGSRTVSGQADGATYYWRIDTYNQSYQLTQGDVWSYTTIPLIPVTDPNLMGWWKFDETAGTIALDWSGRNNHGTVLGTATWIEGSYDGALDFDGESTSVDINAEIVRDTMSITLWMRPRALPYISGYRSIMHNDTWNAGSLHAHLRANTSLANFEFNGGPAISSSTVLVSDTWYHVVMTLDGATHTEQIYVNGVLENTSSGGTASRYIGPMQIGAWQDNGRYFNGAMDDFRVYDKVLTQEEVLQSMRGDPLRAWNPVPANGSLLSLDEAKTLSWSPGDSAVQHDVYFGTDEAAVEAATVGDPMGVYKTRQPGTSYAAPMALGQTYYWRIDEVNGDSSITKGRVWTFTVLGYLVVDDFESYGSVAQLGVEGQRIWYVWLDGYGYTTPPPGYGGNGSGSMVDLGAVSVSGQSLRMDFNNTTVPYSQVEATTSNLLVGSNWNRDGVKSLALSYRGYPASIGGVTQNGTQYTIKGAGADIWNLLYTGETVDDGYHDEFHYMYVAMTPGTHTISAKVESLVNTNGWAKVGVMIRDSLDPKSQHVFAAVTPSSGIVLQNRPSLGAASYNPAEEVRDAGTLAPATAPMWVRLSRQTDGSIEGRYSTDGVTWTLIVSEAAPAITINAPGMYMGLAVCSHVAGTATTAVFSDVKINGNPITGWSNQDVGILSNNGTDPLYIQLATGGTTKRIEHPDPMAVQTGTFQQVNIALSDFSPVSPSNVTNIALGTGTPGGSLGTSGIIYVDDIRLYPPRYISGMLTPWPEDLVQDGTVDLQDAEAMFVDWLEDDYYVTTSAPSSASLVAHYPFEGNANDTSGNNHHGTPNGTVSYTGGVYGQAVSLNGTDAHIVVGSVGISGAAPRTIAGWAKADSLTITNWCNVFGFTNDLTADQGARSFDIEKLGAYNYGYGLHVYSWERPIMDLDLDWHHLAATYDGTTIVWYGDGRLVASEDRVLDTVDNVQMGKRGDNTAYFPGSVDDVYIYSTALSQAEISYLAGNGAATWYVPVLSGANISDDEPEGDKVVNFKDLALILEKFMTTQVWPEE